jgi:hypothetical protein
MNSRACARVGPRKKSNDPNLSKGSCRDSKETAISMCQAPLLALGNQTHLDCALVSATLIATELSKNEIPGMRPQRSRRRFHGVQPNILILFGRVRSPADQESPLAFLRERRPSLKPRPYSSTHLIWSVKWVHSNYACFTNRQPFFSVFSPVACGDDRDRTGNLRLAKPALSQLSYVPVSEPASGRTWIRTKDLSFIRAAL